MATSLAVKAMLRRTQDAGGFATVIAKGNDESGAILVQCAEKGEIRRLMERQLGPKFAYEWRSAGPDDAAKWPDYVALRQKSDPDLWVIELDIADAERFVVENFALG